MPSSSSSAQKIESITKAFPHVFGNELSAVDGHAPKYRAEKIIGYGAFATCLKITRLDSGEHLCMKVSDGCAPERYDEERRAFHREYTLTNASISFSTMRIHGIYEGRSTEMNDAGHIVEKKRIAFIMELFEGESIAEDIRARKHMKMYFTEPQAGFLFLQVAMAVAEAHRNNVMHRDIKPANILMRPSGLVCLADFGLASSNDTSTTMCGTPYYMAPEIWMRQAYTNKVDVWSLGVYLYELLCFDRPFRCPPDFTGGSTQEGVGHAVLNLEPPPLPSTVSPQMREMVMSMLTKDPAKRPSIDEVLGGGVCKSLVVLLLRAVVNQNHVGESLRRLVMEGCLRCVDEMKMHTSQGLSSSTNTNAEAPATPSLPSFRTASSHQFSPWTRSATTVMQADTGEWMLQVIPEDENGVNQDPVFRAKCTRIRGTFITDYTPLSGGHAGVVVIVFSDCSNLRCQFVSSTDAQLFMDFVRTKRPSSV